MQTRTIEDFRQTCDNLKMKPFFKDGKEGIINRIDISSGDIHVYLDGEREVCIIASSIAKVESAGEGKNSQWMITSIWGTKFLFGREA